MNSHNFYRPDRATVNALRERFPVGCRVELLYMNDLNAPSKGALGTVRAVDDLGTIHVNWDCGSSLGVAYGEDVCRRIEKSPVQCSEH